MNHLIQRVFKKKLFKAYEYSLFNENSHPASVEVKEKLHMIREFDSENRLIRFVRYSSNGDPVYERNLSYDDKGRVAREERIYHDAGSAETFVVFDDGDEEVRQVLVDDEPIEETVLQFHPDGKKKKEEQIDQDGNVMDLSEWDEEERLVHRIDNSGEYFIEYIVPGRTKKVRHVMEDGEEIELHTLKDDQLVRIEFLRDDEEVLRREYDYLEGRNVETRVFENGTLVSKETRKYNVEGLLIHVSVENLVREISGQIVPYKNRTEEYGYTETGKLRIMNYKAIPFQQQYVGRRVKPAIISDGLLEIAYDEKDRQAEILLSSYDLNEFEADAYYRFEYEEGTEG
ncbi:MAG: hypothetical protein JW969_10415 [Spirochaetales bacterium]|nr:hypothetical protein [Spirochaetales bacterium]